MASMVKTVLRSPIFRVCCVAVLVAVAVTGCNRANVRIPGASLDITAQQTKYQAKNSVPARIVVFVPTDARSSHYGEKIAGTDWKACETDSLSGDEAKLVVQRQFVAALTESRLFSSVATESPVAGDFVLQSEMRALCSHVVGFVIARAAGISSVQVSLKRGSETLVSDKFERVVTDDQPEYSGSQVTLIEQAMRTLISDSLRELSKNVVARLDKDAASWKK